MTPTHVMVACPVDCKWCNNTGKVAHSFVHGPNGPICPECNGAKFVQKQITLAEFADLFTWGTETDGRTYRRDVIIPRSEG